MTLGSKLAQRFGLEANAELLATLKQTAFKTKEPATDAQLTALLVIADQYGLNPFTKEIYAYHDQYKGIVPVVGVDGWARIVNEHPQFDGMEFVYEPGSVTCRLYRKDRSRPVEVTEFLEECRRGTDPWKGMPRRMLRHKAFIQCARMAFGFAVYDEEEGAIAAGLTIDNATGEIVEPTRAAPRRKSASDPAAVVEPSRAEEPAQATDAAPRSETVASPAPPAAAPGGSAISSGQVAYLRNKMKAAGIDEASILARFGVAGLDAFTAGQFDELKAELLAMA